MSDFATNLTCSFLSDAIGLTASWVIMSVVEIPEPPTPPGPPPNYTFAGGGGGGGWDWPDSKKKPYKYIEVKFVFQNHIYSEIKRIDPNIQVEISDLEIIVVNDRPTIKMSNLSKWKN